MRRAAAVLVAVPVLAACGPGNVLRSKYEATAIVSLQPPTPMPETVVPPAPDDAYVDTEMERIRLPQTIARAVRDGRLATLPALAGLSEERIAEEIASGLEVRRRAKSWLVEVCVRGERRTAVDDMANAVASAFVANAAVADRSDVERRTSALDERIAAADTQVKALGAERTRALAGCSFTAANGQDEARRLSARLDRFVARQDEIALELIRLEAQLRTSASGDGPRSTAQIQRQALEQEKSSLATQVDKCRAEVARVGAVLAKVDDLNARIARQAEARESAMRELEALASRRVAAPPRARVEAVATEPGEER